MRQLDEGLVTQKEREDCLGCRASAPAPSGGAVSYPPASRTRRGAEFKPNWPVVHPKLKKIIIVASVIF